MSDGEGVEEEESESGVTGEEATRSISSLPDIPETYVYVFWDDRIKGDGSPISVKENEMRGGDPLIDFCDNGEVEVIGGMRREERGR